jgi:hypothetical protein
MAPTEPIDWKRIGRELAAPFPPECIQWRPQGRPEAGKRVQIVPYVEARDVQDRLDETVGVGGWAFELSPHVVEAGEVRVARGSLTILGVRKDDLGVSSHFEASKGCASDALKRSGVQFGIARYLYRLPPVYVVLDSEGRVPEPVVAKLREALARRAGQPAQDVTDSAPVGASNGASGDRSRA